jgi:hypothetical protein
VSVGRLRPGVLARTWWETVAILRLLSVLLQQPALPWHEERTRLQRVHSSCLSARIQVSVPDPEKCALILKNVSLILKNISVILKKMSLILKNVSLILKNVSLILKNVSLILKNVAMILKNVSLILKNVSLIMLVCCSTQGVVKCPQACSDGWGVLVLDPQSAPKWRLCCNKCPVVVGVFDGAQKVRVSNKQCDDCGAQLLSAEYKEVRLLPILVISLTVKRVL